MGKFTLVILWRNGNSGMEEGLTWQEVVDWTVGIHDTASQDLIRQILIVPDGEDDPMRIVSRHRLQKVAA